MLWIALILPDLPLQACTRGVDEPGELAIIDHHPRQRVVAATAAALARGIQPGLGMAAALAIAPDLQLKDRDRNAEHHTLIQLATWAGWCTPCVSLDPPDALLLEVSRSLRLFGGLIALVDRLRHGAMRLGLDIRLAAAPTPLAAHWLAKARPDTFVLGTPHWWRGLDPLPVGLLTEGTTVSQTTLELLHGIGMHTLGDIARLPSNGLARRAATSVVQTLELARGERPDPRPWHIPPPCFTSRLVLPAPVSTTEPLLFASRRLVAELVGWLTARHAAVDRCNLHLEHDNASESVLHITTAQPQRDEERFIMLLREQLALFKLRSPVEALRLSADTPVIRAGRTPDMFGDAEQARDAASLLLERLRARLGHDAVHSVRPWPEHRPERAWRTAEPGTAYKPCPDKQPLRPIWLLSEPRPIASLRALILLSGPERIESGWWDGADVRRDYYIARAPRTGRWWIFQRLDPPGGWYLHGYFG
jgi:protein ImuB